MNIGNVRFFSPIQSSAEYFGVTDEVKKRLKRHIIGFTPVKFVMPDIFSVLKIVLEYSNLDGVD
jgi:hypothetical protein